MAAGLREPLFDWLNERAAGMLLHPSSLPGKYGIGTIGREAAQLLEVLAEAEMKYWQILPLNPTGYGDSPYASFSAFAGNPYLIDLEPLIDLGLLKPEDLEGLTDLPQDHVDFGGLYLAKWPVLRHAFRRFQARKQAYLANYGLYDQFKRTHAGWLDPFAYFMALKAHYSGKPWRQWPKEVRTWKAAQQQSLPESVQADAEAQRFFQYLFFGQWGLLRKKARQLGISIMGDVPIFVSMDSADVWASPELFQLDENLDPKAVSGVPPDYFSLDGQLWGNPLFDWSRMKQTGYEWWLRRLDLTFQMIDVVRLDHFRGFSAYWSVPAAATTARTGTWEKGPGLEFFKAVKKKFPDSRIVAEDLGEIDDEVRQLLIQTGLPGMGVLHFGFSLDTTNLHLPFYMCGNQVIYTGTHDNDTTRGWYEKLVPEVQDQVRRFLRVSGEDISWDLIREAYRGAPRLAIIPAQDFLMLGSEARMNTPGIAGGNWQWRMSHDQLDQLRRHAVYLKELAWLTGRHRQSVSEQLKPEG